MDIEKTLQKIAESQLRAEQRADRAEHRADRFEQRADRFDAQMDKFDKQLKATANLVRAGLKLIIKDRKLAKEEWKKQAERNKELDFKLNALIDSQNRSDEKFNRWLEEMRKNRGNGHK